MAIDNVVSVQYNGWFLPEIIRQYCPRKLSSPLKSGMGRGLQPPRPVASRVERTPAAHPLLSRLNTL